MGAIVAAVLPMSFTYLDDSEFEEFAVDLLDALGFVNIEWRKGTGLKSSPADQGRDIEADWPRVDVDETRHSTVGLWIASTTSEEYRPTSFRTC